MVAFSDLYLRPWIFRTGALIYFILLTAGLLLMEWNEMEVRASGLGFASPGRAPGVYRQADKWKGIIMTNPIFL